MALRIKCPVINCNLTFSRQYNVNRHFERFHNNNDISEKCLLCGQIFDDIRLLNKHYRQYHKPSNKFYEKEAAFRKNVVTYRFNFTNDQFNFNIGQKNIEKDIKNTILSEALQKTIVKTSLVYICEMSMIDHAGDKITTTLIPFRSPAFHSNANDKGAITMNIRYSFSRQNSLMEEFCNSGSNWVFDRAVAFDIEITAMRPMLIGKESDILDKYYSNDNNNDNESEKSYLCLENVNKVNIKDIKNKKFLYNPNNKDQKCFLYCLHNFFVKEKKMKKNYQQFEKTLDLSKITFPISIPQIKKFMKQNHQLNISINILLRHTNGHIFPYEYGIGDGKSVLNLLLLYRKNGHSHFLQILNLNKFLRKIYQNHSYEKKYFCENCLNYFYSNEKLDRHKEICCMNKPRMELTPKDSIMKFKNLKNQIPLEYIGFLDFECILPDTSVICNECSHLRCKCDRSFTHIITNQIPIVYSFIILDMNSKIIHEKTYSGEDAADHFVEHLLLEEEKWIKPLFTSFNESELREHEEIHFNNSQKCYLCETNFTTNNIKCCDHCHFTGKYLGAACNLCYIERRKSKKLKIFMHNGSKFDFHFIIKALKDKNNIQNIHVLPYNTENFRTISFNTFMFVDSMSFLQSSLAKLSEDLSKTSHTYNILRQLDLVKTNGSFDRSKFNLILGKSFFPYEYW